MDAASVKERWHVDMNAIPQDDDAVLGEKLFQRRRFLISAGASALFYGMFGLPARAEPAQRILAIAYSGPFGADPNIRNLGNNLAATGANVSIVVGPSRGDLANYLAQTAFDQIFIWDMNINILTQVNEADQAALAAWWAGSQRNLVLDSRAAALFYENDASEQALCRNIVANFASRGGGLWIGAKQAPAEARAANAILAGLDPNGQLFSGSFENISNVTGTENPLLSVPNPVNAAGLRYIRNSAFGRSIAPTTGPGGIPLEVVARDAEMHPLITTNIPEPGFLGLGAGGALMFATRRNKRTNDECEH